MVAMSASGSSVGQLSRVEAIKVRYGILRLGISYGQYATGGGGEGPYLYWYASSQEIDKAFLMSTKGCSCGFLRVSRT